MKKQGRLAVALLVLFAAFGVCLYAADKDKRGDEPNQRSVQGAVTDPSDKPVPGAVVKLENTKTMQIRSFITKEQGTYFFHGLSSDVDYKLTAEFRGSSSSAKTLSSFDNRKSATINLKLK